MRTRTWRLFLMLSILLPASAVLAAPTTFDKQFNAPAGGRLVLNTDVGSVVIVGQDAREVVIHTDISDGDHFEVTAEQNAAGVTVTGHTSPHNWLHWMDFKTSHVRFTIEVPRDYPVQIETSGGLLDVRHLNAPVQGKTSGGGVTVQDMIGSVNVHTSGGNISAERLNGPIQLRTSGGSIAVSDSKGDLDLHTSGGPISLESIEGAVKAATSGGSVHAEVRTNRGVSLTSSGGSITLLLPRSVRATIDAQTSGGRVRSELPLSSSELADNDHLRGSVNGGGEQIYLRTSGGGINVGPLM
jgi:DUF4097 and DUF4098 domain-containing protein YvlB